VNRKSSAIITNLFNSDEFKNIMSRLQPAELREDAKMEVMSIICGMQDSKILRLYNDGALLYYVKKTAHYSLSQHGRLRPKYFPKKVQLPMGDYNIDRYLLIKDRQVRELELEKSFNRLSQEDADLVGLYMKVGNYRAVAKETGIPFISCYKHIRRAVSFLVTGDPVSTNGKPYERVIFKERFESKLKPISI
jgi:hypothetical protein